MPDESGTRPREMTMRVFIGIELPDHVKHTLASVATSIRKRVDRTARKAAIRWVDPNNLHITLWFLGEIDDDRRQQVVERLAVVSRIPAFTVQFGQPGAFPLSGAPRVIWIGIESGAEELMAVNSALTGPLVSLGFEAEKRPYSPHLTVGRVKEMRRSDVPSVRKALQISGERIRCEVTAVTVFQSRLSPKGPHYESLLRVPLS